MGVSRLPELLGGAGVLVMSDAGMDTTWGQMQCDALHLSVLFLKLLVYYDELYWAVLLVNLLIITE
jgi:hypothetical protein